MNKKFRNIAATIMSLAIAAPFVLHADEPAAMPALDIEPGDISEPVGDYFNSTTELITLDDEAREELAELGIDIAGGNDELAGQIIEYAEQHLGRPYRSGAKGPSAFDCSGFTSYIFKNYGISLSPSSRTQYTQGTKIDKDEIRPGDLLFFGGRAGGKTVGHVALAVDVDDNGRVKFIHAASKKGIRYDTYPDGGYYSKRFLGARRVIE